MFHLVELDAVSEIQTLFIMLQKIVSLFFVIKYSFKLLKKFNYTALLRLDYFFLHFFIMSMRQVLIFLGQTWTSQLDASLFSNVGRHPAFDTVQVTL